jgi:hypothetical protein
MKSPASEAPAMSHAELGADHRMPDEIREAWTALYQDVALLHLKWRLYVELYGSQESTALLSNLAQASFQAIRESLRTDMIVAICRLSDPPHMLGDEDLSLATLVGRCTKVPRLDALLTAFQSAAGAVRLLRNRRIPHHDPGSRVVPQEGPFPGIDRGQVDELLRLATAILKAIHGHYCNTELALAPTPVGGPEELINWLKAAWREHELRDHRTGEPPRDS